MMCQYYGCEQVAIAACGVELYAPTGEPITRLVTGMVLCDQHLNGLVPRHVIAPDHLSAFIGMIARTHRQVIDVLATQVVRVALTDPDYVQLNTGRS